MIDVSIIVPVYKVEKYLPQCIESLINQTLRNIEIILIDDGSPDHCGAMCDEYASKDERIKVIHKLNGGVSAARNDGLSAASGEWVLFCDSDDWIETAACEKLYRAGTENNADIVIGDMVEVLNGTCKYKYVYREEFVLSNKADIDYLIQGNFYCSYCPLSHAKYSTAGIGTIWNKLFRRTLLINNNIYFDLLVKGYWDDAIFVSYCMSNAKKIVYIQQPIYNYRIIATSLTNSYNPNILEINKSILLVWDEFLKIYDNDGRFSKSYYATIIRLIQLAFKLYFINPSNKLGILKNIHKIKELIIEDPYKMAIKNCEIKKLSKQHRLIIILLRYKMILLLYFIWKAKKRLL